MKGVGLVAADDVEKAVTRFSPPPIYTETEFLMSH